MKTSKERLPVLYIPSLYFAQGLPYVLVNSVSVILYKTLGVSNTLIGVTSLFYLPWVVKPLWSPVVELRASKRYWIQATEIALALQLALIAVFLQMPAFFILSLIGFILIALTSATHDIAIDGFYMLALSSEQQAFYVGLRSTFYRLAMIFGSGILVILAGRLEKISLNARISWTTVILVCSALTAVLFFFHTWYLPYPAAKTAQPETSFKKVFRSYFQRERIGAILTFILLYRLGEAMLVKMAAPFLLDNKDAGGLALSTESVGYIYGTLGIISLLIGGILGGYVVGKFGLRRCMWPLTLALNLPDLVYVYLSHFFVSTTIIQLCIAIEQFGYGIGFSAFLVFLMYTAEGPYQTAHYAISTGFMALGMLLPGLASGYLQALSGYPLFFIIVCLLTLPGMAAIFFIPLPEQK